MILEEDKQKLLRGESKVSLDSRLVQPGDYFVPVRGENVDGHKFIGDAMESGAVGIVEEDDLYELASRRLERISPTVIAITGSVGKTTMRGFVAAMLSVKYKVCSGILNTKLGLASNIINDMEKGTEFFVAETGMDRAGELTETGKFIKPGAAMLTNISETHMEGLGSLGAIKAAKAEILQTLPKDGVAFLNWDNGHIREVSIQTPGEIVRYGTDQGDYTEEMLPKDLPVIGEHNRLNAVGTYAVGSYFGLSGAELLEGLDQLRPSKGRLNRLEGVNGSVIFDDTYNSSPISATYALRSVADYHFRNNLEGRNLVVLGGMLELGDFEDDAHRIVGEEVANNGFDVVVLVGELAKKIAQSQKLRQSRIEIRYVEDSVGAGEFVRNILNPKKGDVILVKASQGIRLEKTVERLLKDPSKATRLLVRQDARWRL